MAEVSTISLLEHFNSINGGISMWLSSLSDYLVTYGLDEFYRSAHEESNSSPGMARHDDLYFLIRGIKGLGNERLETMITSLKEPFARIRKLDEEYQCCAKSIENAKEQWPVVANRVKEQLVAWESWAVETEIRWRESSSPWPRGSIFDEFSHLKISFDLRGASGLIKSPQELQKDLAFFKKKIKGIDAIISHAYLIKELPEELSVCNFDLALEELFKHQTDVNTLENQKAEIAEKLERARKAYCTQREPLVILLGQLPDTAKWALLSICRQNLREHSDVE